MGYITYWKVHEATLKTKLFCLRCFLTAAMTGLGHRMKPMKQNQSDQLNQATRDESLPPSTDLQEQLRNHVTESCQSESYRTTVFLRIGDSSEPQSHHNHYLQTEKTRKRGERSKEWWTYQNDSRSEGTAHRWGQKGNQKNRSCRPHLVRNRLSGSVQEPKPMMTKRTQIWCALTRQWLRLWKVCPVMSAVTKTASDGKTSDDESEMVVGWCGATGGPGRAAVVERMWRLYPSKPPMYLNKTIVVRRGWRSKAPPASWKSRPSSDPTVQLLLSCDWPFLF